MSKFWPRNTKSAKLSAGQVMEMRARYRKGGITQGQLSIEYKISIVQIGRILRGETWQDVPELAADDQEQTAMLSRLLSVQQETARNRMAEDIAKTREKEKAGDKMLEELNDSGKI